jgi:hypothetical protein
MVGGYVGITLGIQALMPAAPPPGVEQLGDVLVITWGSPAQGVRTASMFLGLLGGLLSALAMVVAPLLLASGRSLSPLAWARHILWQIVRRPKGIGLVLVLALGGPCIGLAEAWEQPYSATVHPDRVVLHTALRDLEGTSLDVNSGDRHRFYLHLDGGRSLDCTPTPQARPKLDLILAALQAASARP